MVGSLDSCTRHVQNNSFLTFTLANKIRFTPALNRTHSLIRSVWFRILYKACLRLQNAYEYQSRCWRTADERRTYRCHKPADDGRQTSSLDRRTYRPYKPVSECRNTPAIYDRRRESCTTTTSSSRTNQPLFRAHNASQSHRRRMGRCALLRSRSNSAVRPPPALSPSCVSCSSCSRRRPAGRITLQPPVSEPSLAQ